LYFGFYSEERIFGLPADSDPGEFFQKKSEASEKAAGPSTLLRFSRLYATGPKGAEVD
jgi:hypothetical protein